MPVNELYNNSVTAFSIVFVGLLLCFEQQYNAML